MCAPARWENLTEVETQTAHAAAYEKPVSWLHTMSVTFEPRLDILPESQRRLWPELDAVPSEFVLYGGTALALQLGHRISEDFDFFSSSGFDPDRLCSMLPFFRELELSNSDAWVHCKRDNLEALWTEVAWSKSHFLGASIR